MNPLSALFGAVASTRNALYDRGLLRVRHLDGPVISVGNLSVGGAGKTPFVILLGSLLKVRGIAFDVLTRGYGRSSRGVALVDCAGSSRQYGDEPMLIAKRLQVPVIVGEDRYIAGRFAERKYGPQLHLLDDGFQHRQLARDFNIVLISPDDAHGTLLPTGRLREPLTSLSRADAVVLTPGATTGGLPLQQQLVWHVRRGIALPQTLQRPVAFCGIARPERFFRQLQEAGIELAAEVSFRDHHAFSEKDIRQLLRVRAQAKAEGFVTTEKDAMNLGRAISRLQPVSVVPVTMELENASAALAAMLARIAERRKL
jgi:tetraacyldisaccharide 4'-kinase